MPQHPCPSTHLNIDNGNAYAWGTGTGADGPAATAAAQIAQSAHAKTHADRLAQGHSCKAGCVLVGRITWNLPQRGSFIIGVTPNGAGGYVFTVFSFGRFTAEIKCRRIPGGAAAALQEVISGGVGWEIRRAD